jgi:hypothetical protein
VADLGKEIRKVLRVTPSWVNVALMGVCLALDEVPKVGEDLDKGKLQKVEA